MEKYNIPVATWVRFEGDLDFFFGSGSIDKVNSERTGRLEFGSTTSITSDGCLRSMCVGLKRFYFTKGVKVTWL